MCLNPFMHKRNPYFGKNKTDFGHLSAIDDEFKKVVNIDLKGKVSIDFGDKEVVRVLTETLLKHHHNLNVKFPANTDGKQRNLVPTLPLRFNYLLWIQDIIQTNKTVLDFNNISGFDLGCGPLAIYPLLASRHFKWKMFASEIDETSYNCAVQNVTTNNLGSSIQCFKTGDNNSDDNFFSVINNVGPITFTMCNPPFFHDDTSESVEAGKDHEVMTVGGEERFVKRLIENSHSLVVAARKSNSTSVSPIFFTCMLGHKKTMASLKPTLVALTSIEGDGIKSFVFTEFCQGRTMRWAVAWTFKSDIHLSSCVSELRRHQLTRRKHKPIIFELSCKRSKVNVENDFSFSITNDNLFMTCANKCLILLVKLISKILDECKFFVKVNRVSADHKQCSLSLKTYDTEWRHRRRKRREEMKKLATVTNGHSKNVDDSVSPPASKIRRIELCEGDSNGRNVDNSNENTMTDDHDDTDDDESNTSSSINNDKPISIQSRMIITLIEDDLIMSDVIKFTIQMSYLSGYLGRDCFCEIVQFVQNQLF